MAELKSWSIYSAGEPEEEIFFLGGAVFGHTSPHCKDGTYTRTTTIESMTDKGDELEVCTKNTIYTLKKQNIASNKDLSEERRKDVLCRCLTRFMGDLGNAIAQELMNINQAKRQRSMERAQALGYNMFWLELSPDCHYYFDKAYYKLKTGEVLSDEKLVHVGTFQDSVILDGCGVRYFPYQQNSLKFYNTFPVMLMGEPEAPTLWGYIYNSGSTPLRVKFTWGKTIEILPGETVPFDKDELEKYPDSELLSLDDLYSAIDISSLQNKS